MQTDLTKEFILEMLEYIPSTGMLLQKKPRPKIKVGSIAGVITPKGYRYIQLQGRKYAAHRLVWLLEHGKFPSLFIDHIDGNRLNNRIENLREATACQNSYNRGAQANNRSGEKGVHWKKQIKHWVVEIQVNKVKKYLGIYKDLELAALVATEARDLYHGKFARQGA